MYQPNVRDNGISVKPGDKKFEEIDKFYAQIEDDSSESSVNLNSSAK